MSILAVLMAIPAVYFTLKGMAIYIYRVLISDGGGWDHVSVSLDKKRCATWEELCWIKDLFFEDEEAVIQIHPKKSEYVNQHPTTLHLWRYQEDFPLPDPLMVGNLPNNKDVP